MGRRIIDPRKRRCQCGYCGRADSTAGILFIPKRKNQVYASKIHFLRHQYNGRTPMRKKCACGCGKIFYTINEDKHYINNHQKLFLCSLCGEELSKDEVITKEMNDSTFNFCEKCYDNIR